MNKLVASGLIIIHEGKLLVSHDGKDNFWKIPGGKPLEKESLEECAIRELKEETGFDGKCLEKLNTMYLTKKPQTGEIMNIFLYHFKGNLIPSFKNYSTFEYNHHKISWLSIEEIKKNKYDVAPNIKFLIEKGDIN